MLVSSRLIGFFFWGGGVSMYFIFEKHVDKSIVFCISLTNAEQHYIKFNPELCYCAVGYIFSNFSPEKAIKSFTSQTQRKKRTQIHSAEEFILSYSKKLLTKRENVEK